MDEDRLRDLTNQKDTHIHVVNVTQKVSQKGGNSGCLSWIGGTVVVLIVLAMITRIARRLSICQQAGIRWRSHTAVH